MAQRRRAELPGRPKVKKLAVIGAGRASWAPASASVSARAGIDVVADRTPRRPRSGKSQTVQGPLAKP